MKIKHIALGIAMISFTASVLFIGCKKKTKTEKDSDTAAASDNNLASATVNDLTNIADEAGRTKSIQSFKGAEASGLLATSCATLTFDTLAAAKTITVNFGATNCLGNDSRNRRGIITINFTGRYRDSATIITVTPQNYFVNDNQVSGSKTIKNNGRNAANHITYSINATITITKANNAGTITWNSQRQREWITGENTLTWNDDVYSITGTASGTSANNNAFTSTIITPLIRNMSVGCRRHFTSGVIEHLPSGKATRTIDFGNGACDDQATVTINGTVYNITLP